MFASFEVLFKCEDLARRHPMSLRWTEEWVPYPTYLSKRTTRIRANEVLLSVNIWWIVACATQDPETHPWNQNRAEGRVGVGSTS